MYVKLGLLVSSCNIIINSIISIVDSHSLLLLARLISFRNFEVHVYAVFSFLDLQKRLGCVGVIIQENSTFKYKSLDHSRIQQIE